jgi:hypothetical protein
LPFRRRFLERDRETAPRSAGRTRRFHEGARHHCADGAARQADRRWLRHLGHTHFRSCLGLHIGHGIGSTAFILTRLNHFGNTHRNGLRHTHTHGYGE